jgi:hypothetical protein
VDLDKCQNFVPTPIPSPPPTVSFCACPKSPPPPLCHRCPSPPPPARRTDSLPLEAVAWSHHRVRPTPAYPARHRLGSPHPVVPRGATAGLLLEVPQLHPPPGPEGRPHQPTSRCLHRSPLVNLHRPTSPAATA